MGAAAIRPVGREVRRARELIPPPHLDPGFALGEGSHRHEMDVDAQDGGRWVARTKSVRRAVAYQIQLG